MTKPGLYFRTRDNGALVFRVGMDVRQRRLTMTQIAIANTRTTEIKPHGQEKLTEEEQRQIADWIRDRVDTQEERDTLETRRFVEELHKMSQWAQARATDRQIEEQSDDILMAMHDLRSVLVRRKANLLD